MIDTNIYEIFLELVSNRHTVNVFIPRNGTYMYMQQNPL